MGFLTTKKLNCRQVKQAEEFIKYYFKIKYTKETKNIKINILNRKAKLQGNKGVLKVILKMDTNGKIKYNYLQFLAISKAVKLKQLQQIKEVQEHDLDIKYYKN